MIFQAETQAKIVSIELGPRRCLGLRRHRGRLLPGPPRRQHVAGSDRGLPGVRPALDGVRGGRRRNVLLRVVIGGNVDQSADPSPVEGQADRARLLHQLSKGGRPLGQGECDVSTRVGRPTQISQLKSMIL